VFRRLRTRSYHVSRMDLGGKMSNEGIFLLCRCESWFRRLEHEGHAYLGEMADHSGAQRLGDEEERS